MMCPMREIRRGFMHIAAHKTKGDSDTFLSSYWIGKEKYDVIDVYIRATLKFSPGALS